MLRWARYSLAFFLSSFAFGVAAETNYRVHRDAAGLPRCLESLAPAGPGYFLSWNKNDQYRREIKIIDLRSPIFFQNSMSVFACADWKDVERNVLWLQNQGHIFPVLPDTAREYGGLVFDYETRRVLHLIRHGANAIPAFASAEEYLRAHPISVFDTQVNRQLSLEYGFPFAAQVYRAWREARVSDQVMRNAVLSYAGQFKPGAPQDLSRGFKGRKILIVKGYFESPQTGGSWKLKTALERLNLQAEILAVDTTRPVQENAPVIAAEIERRLRDGERLLLIASSKGATETLGALSLLYPNVDSGRWPGRIDGVVVISANIGGSFIADWAVDPLAWLKVDAELRSQAQTAGLPIRGSLFEGMDSLTSQAVQNYLAPAWSRLPRNTTYFEFTGILPPDGFFKDPFVARMQEELLNRWMFPLHGANEGFIEYPKSELPVEKLSRVFHLTFESSHGIFDGRFGPYVLEDAATQSRVLAAIMSAIHERVLNSDGFGLRP